MLFNSITYLLFLSLSFCAYWLLKSKSRLLFILLCSLTFYGFWRVDFLILLLFSASSDYWIAHKISQNKENLIRRNWLILSLIVNLGLLFYFKYLYFFVSNFSALLSAFDNAAPWDFNLSIVLPLGISFYTFQTISYVVDVYRGHIKPEKKILNYLCFVTFFPQLVAGPIMRAGPMLFQLSKPRRLDWTMITNGLKFLLVGLFLKVVLADNIAPLVDSGFNTQPTELSAWDVLTLSFLFGLQIYFDFSAYSHIAMGSASFFGIKLPINFKHPYSALSPKDFWGRWHISLSNWVRDYIYVPLVKRCSNKISSGSVDQDLGWIDLARRKNIMPLCITWVLMGLWHGADWNFVLWGLIHALIISSYRVVENLGLFVSSTSTALLGWLFTVPVIMLAWIPFRSGSLTQTFEMFSRLMSIESWLFLGMRENIYLITALLFFFTVISPWLGAIIRRYVRQGFWFGMVFDCLAYSILTVLVFIFLRPIDQFIYFQF